MPSLHCYDIIGELNGNSNHQLIAQLISAGGYSLNSIGSGNRPGTIEISVKEELVSKVQLLNSLSVALPMLRLDKESIIVKPGNSVDVVVSDSRGEKARGRTIKVRWLGPLWISNNRLILNDLGIQSITFSNPGCITSQPILVDFYSEDNSAKSITLQLSYTI